MNHAFQVVKITFDRDKVVSHHKTREKAVEKIERFPKDYMGSVVMTIREIWTNDEMVFDD